VKHTIVNRSAHILSSGYDPDERVMQITFHNGDTHEFRGVPEQIYQSFQNAPSKGKFYHKVIAARFHGEKI
jgi:UDP-galactopyranose mutase